MDNTSQSNNKPDYSFILDDPSANKSPKKNNKKVLMIIGLLVIVFILFIVNVVSQSSDSVKQSSSSGDDTTQASGQETATVKNFFSAVGANETDKSYGLLTDTDITEEDFTNFDMPYLLSLKLEECKFGSTTKSEEEVKVRVECPSKKTDASVKFVFSLNNGDSAEIRTYSLEVGA